MDQSTVQDDSHHEDHDDNHTSSGSENESNDEEDGGGLVLMESWYLSQPDIVDAIIQDMKHNYYVSKDWSPSFYIQQAYIGCIAVSHGDTYILPEMQKKYCILELQESSEAQSKLHISKRFVKKLKKMDGDVSITLNQDLSGILNEIKNCHGGNNWLESKYASVMETLFEHGYAKIKKTKFRLLSVELWHNGKLVAGKLGYTFGAVYTSLTGFCHKQLELQGDKQGGHSNYGTIQLLALGSLLKQAGFDFWNLGHPPRPDCMKYKSDIGGRVVHRFEFIEKWSKARDGNQGCTETLLAKCRNELDVKSIF